MATRRPNTKGSRKQQIADRRRELVLGNLLHDVNASVGSLVEIVVRKGARDHWYDFINQHRMVDYGMGISKNQSGISISGYVAEFNPYYAGQNRVPTFLRLTNTLDENLKPDLQKGFTDIDYLVMHSARLHKDCLPYYKLF